MDSSDDDSNSDDELGQTVRQIVQKAKTEKIRLGTVLKKYLYDYAGPVMLVSLNERMKENDHKATIEDASQVFNLDANFNDIKHDLLLYSSFQNISNLLY